MGIRPHIKYKVKQEFVVLFKGFEGVLRQKTIKEDDVVILNTKNIIISVNDVAVNLALPPEAVKYLSLDKRLLTKEQRDIIEKEERAVQEFITIMNRQIEKGATDIIKIFSHSGVYYHAFGSLLFKGDLEIALDKIMKVVQTGDRVEILRRGSSTSISIRDITKIIFLRDKYDLMMDMLRLYEPTTYDTIKELPDKDKIAKCKELFLKPIWLTKSQISNSDIKPLTPSFGYEIEFCEGETTGANRQKLERIREVLNTTGDTREYVDIEIGQGQLLTIMRDKYKNKSDVVKVYEDHSIGYEVVTRPFRFNEMESCLTPIYKKIKKVIKVPNHKFKTAGGHITMMEGCNMDEQMHPLVLSNMIQLTRAFEPIILLLSSEDGEFRGTEFYKMNSKSSAQSYLESEKYNVINKRVVDGKVTGIEMRSFRSPPNAKVCEDNAKIMFAIWRVAERLAMRRASVSISQLVISVNKFIQERCFPRRLYKKKELFMIPGVSELSKVFVDMIKLEAEKLGIMEEIEKRLTLTASEKVSVTDDEFIEYTNCKIKGDDVVTKMKEKFGKRYKVIVKELGGN